MLPFQRSLIAVCLLACSLPSHLLAEKPSFTVGWSVYVGWNPYYYMAKSGILRKWADKYGINIKVQRFDYAPSLDAFVAKNIDACAMTNMETLDMPAAAGVDTTAILIGDYSNGNDAVLARKDITLQQIPGKQVMLVEKTVSQYLFERAMVLNGLGDQLKKVHYLNTSDAGHCGGVSDRPEQGSRSDLEANGVANRAQQGASGRCSTRPRFRGEILDLLVVRTDVLESVRTDRDRGSRKRSPAHGTRS